MKNFELTAVYEPCDESGFLAYIEEIPGINSQGETIDEAKENLADAINLMFQEIRASRSKRRQRQNQKPNYPNVYIYALVKRRKLIKHIESNACILVREGGKHSLYKNIKTNKLSTIPRHPDIKEGLCRKICKDLGIPDVLKNS